MKRNPLSRKRYDARSVHDRSAQRMADRGPFGGPQSAAGVDAPQLTRLNLFATPLLIATLPEAQAINTELKRMILAREAASGSAQRSVGGWQSPWDMHQWGGAPTQR